MSIMPSGEPPFAISGSVLSIDNSSTLQWDSSTTPRLISSYGNAVSIENGLGTSTTDNSGQIVGGGYVQGTITNYPNSIYGYPYQPVSAPLTETKKDELKSDPKEASPMSHTLNGILRIYGDSVVIEYFCKHCNQVLHTEVISKVPKSIIEEKCLPKIVDGVK